MVLLADSGGGEVQEKTASDLFLFLYYSGNVELDCVDVKDYVCHDRSVIDRIGV